MTAAVGKDQPALSEESELLQALQMKAAAFADKRWETYWLKEGPGILANGWIALYPHIPLSRVEEVCVCVSVCLCVCDVLAEGGAGDPS